MYSVHNILIIGITGSLGCVPLVHPLPFLSRDGTVYCLCHFYFTAIFHPDQKSHLVPSTAVSFLGFICDSDKQVFLLPQGKRTKFTAEEKLLWVIRQSLWGTSKVRGENHLLCVLVPAAKLFTNSARQAISRGVKSANNKLLISPELRDELLHTGGFWAHGDVFSLGSPRATSIWLCIPTLCSADGEVFSPRGLPSLTYRSEKSSGPLQRSWKFFVQYL